MEAVKTYRNVNKLDSKITFSVSKMQDIYDKRGGKVDEPHRHDFYTLVFTEKAKGTHKIDFNAYPLEDKSLFFISPGQVHQIIEEKKSYGYALVFSADFLAYNNISTSFIEDLNLFNDFEDSPPLKPSDIQFEEIRQTIEKIFSIHQSGMSYELEAIGALLKYILILCTNSCNLSSDDISSSKSLLKQFKGLIEEHYKKEHHTSFYAELLHITPDHLNKVVKMQSGKSAKEHIQSRITIAAKRLLYFSDLTNKEIAFELGFSEPANFSAFFKKCVGMSPSQFKLDS
ncbi:AraC family transcriptional regulator [Flammeovirga yaeyamensis]|uniref:AraC family transcriptional regulator n=1 Tax=Flammeovirga yaeyamensis TaxID=367791 RepID=A0AAX1NA77_9BACT|nr:helix-turn-helix domain-containing protein [Flammeovirga yaeyamensis]MBB3697554.1 AraC-like DNA-binding protein [Flammeovirga yaeyamensis]NMF36248.1 AraC family transcriptional regulator [Flammeovirga yaeyamensis]QWG02977.1 AraC family transcriptional regulator [Flammeovirga yaeyamensis]